MWPTDQFPLRQVGRLVLDTNIENFHNENEQIAFSPGRVVPGDDWHGIGCCLSADVLVLKATYSFRDQAFRLWLQVVHIGFELTMRLLCANPGITYSNDKVLQSRINAYQDTQRYRIGVK